MKSKIYGWVGVIEVEFFMGKNVFMHKFPECDGALQWWTLLCCRRKMQQAPHKHCVFCLFLSC